MRWIALLLSLTTQTVRIPAGTFVMGSDHDELDERPAHRVTLAAFDLDRDEVTALAYARCVLARVCAPPRRPSARFADAVTWVSHEDAERYCRFAGMRLPTEAEWERAARDGDGRVYPWGDDFDCSRGNFANYRGEGRCPKNPGHPVEPGRFPGGDSKEGAHDLAGNVWEWVSDWYEAGYYAKAPSTSPKGPTGGERKVVKGGACCSMFGLPRSANRLAFPASFADEDLGFRCARDAR